MNPPPLVYGAIRAITARLAKAGIAKARHNDVDGYAFRSIDDIYNNLAPLLARYQLCILPRVIERQVSERRNIAGEAVFCVAVRSAFEFVSVRDGSSHVVEGFGEAIDASDKGTSKAMAAAYKYAIIQAFCIPTSAGTDADATSPKIKAVVQISPEPDQGWGPWALDIQSLARACETDEALTRLQSTYRKELRALSLSDAGLYNEVGETLRARRAALAAPKRQAA